MRHTAHNFDGNRGLEIQLKSVCITVRNSMSSSKDSESENPKERLAKYGADSLSIQELLAVLLFPGYSRNKAIEIAVNLLKTFNGNLINLFTATIHQLTQVKGIGFVKACQITAVFELGNRVASYYEEMHP